MKRIILTLLLVLLTSITAFSQDSGDYSIQIEQVNSEKFPFMEVYFTVADSKGVVVPTLIQGNFATYVDGKDTKKLDIRSMQFSEEPVSYSVIISSNGIMEGQPLSLQKEAVVEFIERLRDKEKDLISLYTFGEQVTPIFEKQHYDPSLIDLVNSIEVHEEQPKLIDAVTHVARLQDDVKVKKKVILLLSDGRDVDSQFTREQCYEILREKNIPVYSLGIKVLAGRNLYTLDEMAQSTGGRYMFARYPRQIKLLFKSVIDYVQLGYVARFKTTSIKGDNKHHQLHLKLTDKEKENSTYINFIAHKKIFPWWLKFVLLGIGVVVLIVFIIILILVRKKQRELMGITKRKCPVCKCRMKDDWDECHFCKYLPKSNKKKKTKK